jgi:5-methylcytosine-specific restriction endonuclease McrA
MASRAIRQALKVLRVRVPERVRTHRIVKVPATARIVPANRALLLKVKVQGKAQELPALPMASRAIRQALKVLRVRVPERVRTHRIVKVPATARIVPANRALLPKVKVQGKAQELPALPMVSRTIRQARKVPRARVPERVRANRKARIPAMEQVPVRAKLAHSVRAAGKTAALTQKPDYECSRRSSGPCRSRFRS